MEKRFLNIKETAEYLGLSKGTLYVWVCRRKISYHKFGGAVRFDLREIEGWAKGNRVKEIC